MGRFQRIFDIDGTLIDSVDLHASSWVDSFARFGVRVKFDEVRRHIGEGADRLIPAFVPTKMSEDKRKQIEEFRSDLFKRQYLDRVKRFPKVRQLFQRIKYDGCKIVLASSCAADEIDQYKSIAGIIDMTDHDVTADDVRCSKPSPDVFLKALDRLAPISPSETCAIGDTKYDGEAASRPAFRLSVCFAEGPPRRSSNAPARSRFTAILLTCSRIGAAGET